MTAGHSEAMTKPTLMSIHDLRHNLGRVLTEAQHSGQRTVLTRDGKPVAAIISVNDLTHIEMLESGGAIPDIDTNMQNIADQRASTRRFVESIAAGKRPVR